MLPLLIIDIVLSQTITESLAVIHQLDDFIIHHIYVLNSWVTSHKTSPIFQRKIEMKISTTHEEAFSFMNPNNENWGHCVLQSSQIIQRIHLQTMQCIDGSLLIFDEYCIHTLVMRQQRYSFLMSYSMWYVYDIVLHSLYYVFCNAMHILIVAHIHHNYLSDNSVNPFWKCMQLYC